VYFKGLGDLFSCQLKFNSTKRSVAHKCRDGDASVPDRKVTPNVRELSRL
jgi:hypothetical protein